MSSFKLLVESRCSVRQFDADASFDHSAVERALKLATKSPNSSNLQMWEFHRVRGEKLKEISLLCMGQTQALNANEIVFFVTRRDMWQRGIEFNLNAMKKIIRKGRGGDEIQNAIDYYLSVVSVNFTTVSWFRKIKAIIKNRFVSSCTEVGEKDIHTTLHKNCAMAALMFCMGLKDEGYETCMIEGMDTRRIKKALGLPKCAKITVGVCCGATVRKSVGHRRLSPNKVIFEHT